MTLKETRPVPEDVLRICAEHVNELADVLRAARSELRAELADDFSDALLRASEGEEIDWPALLDGLHAREKAWGI